jgi:hypothetical protein
MRHKTLKQETSAFLVADKGVLGVPAPLRDSFSVGVPTVANGSVSSEREPI